MEWEFKMTSIYVICEISVPASASFSRLGYILLLISFNTFVIRFHANIKPNMSVLHYAKTIILWMLTHNLLIGVSRQIIFHIKLYCLLFYNVAQTSLSPMYQFINYQFINYQFINYQFINYQFFNYQFISL